MAVLVPGIAGSDIWRAQSGHPERLRGRDSPVVALEWALSAGASVLRVPNRLRPGSAGDVGPPGRAHGGWALALRSTEPECAGTGLGPLAWSRGRRAPAHQAEAARQACQGREPTGVGNRKWRNRSGVLRDGWVLTVAEAPFWGKRALESTVGALVMSLECHMIGT
jgi:hypothetical protein